MNKLMIVEYQGNSYDVEVEDYFIFQANGSLKEQILRKYTITKLATKTPSHY